MIQQCLIDLKVYSCLCIATAVTLICSIIGIDTAAFKFLLFLITVDYMAGMIVAGVYHKSKKTKSGKISSAAGFKGGLKKASELLVVYLGVRLEQLTHIEYTQDMIIAFYIGIESISILENLGIMGVRYPKALKRALDALCEEGDDCTK